jgi:hypothetical protein
VRKTLARVVSEAAVVVLIACPPVFSQFTLNSVSMAPPNNTIPIKLTGTAAGKSSGIFTLSSTPHAMRYDSAAKSFELDLDQPGINAVYESPEAALASDGTHYAGWDQFQSTYILALGTHSRCVMWTEGVGKQILHPSDYGDSWCVAVDHGNAVGTAYLQFNQSVCIQNAGCTNILRTYMTAVMNGAPIVTSPNFCFTPVSFGNGGDCFSRARGISGDDVVGDYNGPPGPPTDPLTITKSFGSALDPSPQANPFPYALLWHPSTQSVIQLHPAGFVSSIAIATNGIQQGGWATDATGSMHAILWSGSAASALDLAPAGYSDTRITGISTNFQAGDGWAGGAANTPGTVHHGLVWQGTPGSVLDLNQFLPVGYTHLTITGVDAGGNIAGYMQTDVNGIPAIGSEVGVLFTPAPSVSVSTLSLSSATETPGNSISGVVTLGAPAAAGGVLVNFSSSNPALIAAPAPLLIPEGQTSASFTLTVSATAFQPSTTVVTLAARTGYVSRSAQVTVNPQAPADAIVSLALSPGGVTAGDAVSVQVGLANPAPAAGAIVSFSSSNPNVLPAPASIVVPAGQSSVSISAPTNPAPLYQPASVVLSAATGTVVQQGTVSVASLAKPVSVFLGGAQNAVLSAPGGTSGSGFVSLSAIGLSPAAVTLTNTNPALTVPAVLTQPSNSTFANFNFSSLPVPVATTGTLTATANGASASSTITITATPSPSIQSFTIPLVSPTQTWSSGDTLTGTVTLSGPAYLGGMIVALAADNPSAVTMPASITIPAGGTTASFAVKASQVTAPAAVTISATLPGFAAVPVALTILPGPALAITSFSLNPYAMIGPGVVTNGTITLNQPAPAGGVAVALAAAPNAAKVASSVTVPQGQLAATFTIQGNSVSGPTAVSLTASYKGVLAPLGISAGASLTVAPADTLKIPKGTPTWSTSTHLLTVTATSTNPQAIITVLNANGNVPLGTMAGDGSGNYTFQTTIASISSVNLKSNLGGATGQGITVAP